MANHPDFVPENIITELDSVTEQIRLLISELGAKNEQAAKAKTQLILTRLPWIKTYNTNYGELLVLFEGNKRLCDGFYIKTTPGNDTVETALTSDTDIEES